MKRVKVCSLVFLSLLLWGCSNSSTPSATTSDPKPPAPTSFTHTQQKYEAALADVVQSCKFENTYFFQTNEQCDEGSYPTLLAEQITSIENNFIPAAEDYIALLEDAQFLSEVQKRQKNYLLSVLTQLKKSQSTITQELSNKSSELETANKSFQKILSELVALGCRQENIELHCDDPVAGSGNNIAPFFEIQHKIYLTIQALEKINKIYESLSNSNIHDFNIKKNLLVTFKTENKELIQNIVSFQVKPIEDILIQIDEKAKSYFKNFKIHAASDAEFQFFQSLPHKEQISDVDLKIFSEKYSLLKSFLDFLTREESLIRSKLVNNLILDGKNNFSKYSMDVYDQQPTGSEFKVILPLNANMQDWVNYFKILDESTNNALLVQRQEKIDKIQSHILNIDKAAQRNPFPVTLVLPSEALEDLSLSKSLEIYLAIDQFVTDDIPTYLNQKVHKNLAGDEQVKIQYVSQFSALPKSTNKLLILSLKEEYFDMMSSDYLKTQMTIEIFGWLENFNK